MSLVVFDRPNNGGQVTINAALVRGIQVSNAAAPQAATRLIFDEHDQFEVVGDVSEIAEIIGFSL